MLRTIGVGMVLLVSGCFADVSDGDTATGDATATGDVTGTGSGGGTGSVGSASSVTAGGSTSAPTSTETGELGCFTENWESQVLDKWEFGGNFGAWLSTSWSAFDGAWSVVSPAVKGDGRAWIRTTVDAPPDAMLRYFYASDFGDGTRLAVFVDDVEVAEHGTTGTNIWLSHEVPFPAGLHEVEFAVERTDGADLGFQQAWLDAIEVCP